MIKPGSPWNVLEDRLMLPLKSGVRPQAWIIFFVQTQCGANEAILGHHFRFAAL